MSILNPPAGTRVVIGLSGGVDSAVSAYILKQQGYDVIGLLMRNWDDEHCPIEDDARDVARVCALLDLPHYTVDFSQAYRDRVFTSFLESYRRGLTPNPDVLCNREIKFGELLSTAQQLGASHVATGHYAGIRFQDPQYELIRSIDSQKDQTYFLHRLSQKQLEHALFPLSMMTKTEVRALANNIGLPIAQKKDSTGICFIGERPFRSFLKQFITATPGAICDMSTGKIVGTHEGCRLYTIGQRQGLGIGGGGSGEPWFVVDKDIATNTVYVVQGEHHPARFASQLIASDVHWIAGVAPHMPFACRAMIRYRQAEQEVIIEQHDETHLIATFAVPQKGISPGQSIVFYRDQVCLGGAIIDQALRHTE